MPINIKEEVELKNHSTFKIGGKAKYFVKVQELSELKEALKWALDNKVKYFILGGGSNVLFSDEGFDGLIIKLKSDKIEIDGKNKIVCQAGVALSSLVEFAKENDLSGLEWATGIPGTVGGAIRGNAGAFGSEISDSVIKIQALEIDNKEFTLQDFTKSECQFNYRESIFKRNESLIIQEIELSFKNSNKEEIQKLMNELIKKREKSQPSLKNFYSAGSIFKNPKVDKEIIKSFEQETGAKCKDEKVPAGWLIDMCNLKGLQAGDAQVSSKQANFIVNKGNANSQDVVTLISLIKQKVRNNYGIQLQEEVKLVGF
ncbi:MAG: UDP-N-acetylmuramate dehydrogenase [Patescibacteria group bacterium]